MNRDYIYADNAATTVLDNDAYLAMQEYQEQLFFNPSQPYGTSVKIKKSLEEARKSIAKCINADPDEIYFTSGGSESDNWAIKGIAYNVNEKSNIITSKIEHHAVLNSCSSMEKYGYKILLLDNDNTGLISENSLKEIINESTALVSIMLANNEIGTIQPIKELCKIAHESKAIFHTDAVQAVGHIKIDVKDLNIDMLSASAHKFNGPKGIGFLYIKKGTPINSLIDGGSQEKSKRAGTENVPNIIGMAKALEKNVSTIEVNQEYLYDLEKYFFDELNKTEINYIRNGNIKKHLPGNINISIKNANGETILHRLDLMKIYISTGSACDGRNNQISHVINAIDVDPDYAKGTIRISLCKDNTKKEIDAIITGLCKILKS